MKKSTIAVAALLTALSSAPVVSVAYADDAAPAANGAATQQGSCSGSQCAGKNCSAGSNSGCCAGKNDE